MEKIVVVGAGLVGSLQAIFLAKRGFDVHVFERREDLRKAEIIAGRSINLALSDRGWQALDAAGVSDQIRKISIPMYGRMMHAVSGELTPQQYGLDGEAIYSVSRGELNRSLLVEAGKYENVTLHFNQRCQEVDLENTTLRFKDGISGKENTVKADRIIGTDGAFSAVRNKLMRTDRFNYSQHYLQDGYKELTIPPAVDGGHRMDKNALHIWPRGRYMLIALPNLDGSFTCTLFFPFEGKPSFETLTTKEEVTNFFEEIFPDAVPVMPTLAEDFFNNPTASLVTVKCSPWNYKDKVLIIGDAAHAIVPFYGQGMNSGFEDCTVLNEFMDRYLPDWGATFEKYAVHRKPDADAISDLALRNFIEMRDLVGDTNFLVRKRIEKKIYEKYPEKWIPLYSMVTFSNLRYSEALAAGQAHDKIMDEIMEIEGIDEHWNSKEVEHRILDMLAE